MSDHGLQQDLQQDLQYSNYRYFIDISTRWMDNDIYGHVNNVSYYSYFDTAANTFLINKGGLDIQRDKIVGFVVASNCEYKKPIAFPQQLEIGFRANKISNRSVEYGLAVFVKGESEAVACGSFTHVFVDKQSNKAVAIPEKIRKALSSVIYQAL